MTIEDGKLELGGDEPTQDELDELNEGADDLPIGRRKYEFLTGVAGTGKSFLVRELAARGLAELTATTGIAAVNLGEDVSTLNATLGYFNTDDLRDQWTVGRLTAKLAAIYHSGCRRLVIDEVSMMDGTQLTVLVAALEQLMEASRPVDLGLTLTGDFLQLPPVKASFVFEEDVWEHFKPGIVKLTEIRRQQDKEFIEALGWARKGHGRKAAEYFEQFMYGATDREFPGATLWSKNEEVDRYNYMKHSELPGEPMRWAARKAGEQRSEWTKNIPDVLLLKPGARVMVLANCRNTDPEGNKLPGYLYANGDLAEVVDQVDAEAARVKLYRNGREVVVKQVVREHKKPLTSERRKQLEAAGKVLPPDQRWETVGSIGYMPLRLAYGTTVHKSQGLSLDAVQLNYTGHFWSHPGMLYVALSRARTPQGLRLVGGAQTFVRRLTTDPRVKAWVE